MKFGPVPIAEAAGAILAHGVRAGTVTFKKGRVLTPEDVARLAAAEVKTVIAARLEPGDALRAKLYRNDGELLFAPTVRSSSPIPIRLVPGDYRVVIERDGADPDERSFVVGQEPVDVSLTR